MPSAGPEMGSAKQGQEKLELIKGQAQRIDH
jgi:hypothetical protein